MEHGHILAGFPRAALLQCLPGTECAEVGRQKLCPNYMPQAEHHLSHPRDCLLQCLQTTRKAEDNLLGGGRHACNMHSNVCYDPALDWTHQRLANFAGLEMICSSPFLVDSIWTACESRRHDGSDQRDPAGQASRPGHSI